MAEGLSYGKQRKDVEVDAECKIVLIYRMSLSYLM